MKKITLITLAFIILLGQAAFALDNKFIDIRGKMLTESQEIKSMMANTKDIIVVNSIWGACVITINQLDAYFALIGIFNTIKKEDLSNAAIDPLINWLSGIKGTNDVNIKSLTQFDQGLQADTQTNIEKLKDYYGQLDTQIDEETKKLAAYKRSLAKASTPAPADTAAASADTTAAPADTAPAPADTAAASANAAY